MEKNLSLERKPIWFYKPDGKWFYSRKEVKDYLGGLSAFNKACKNGDIIFTSYTNQIWLDLVKDKKHIYLP